MNLIINSRALNETTCMLDMEGDVDFYTSLQLNQDLMQAAERGIHRVIVNLSKVEYMDCAGLGALMSSLKRLREANGTLARVGLGLRIQRLFEATGAAKIFDIYSTEEKAIAEEMSESRAVKESLYV